MPLKLVMFSDFICPFCYIGFETVRRLKPEFDFELEWRGFEIHPDWPAEGMPAEKFYGAVGPGLRNGMWERIKGLAERIGLVMNPPSVVTNSRLALEAAEFAREAGLGEAFEERIFRAYFRERANIGDAGLIGELGAEVGLERAALADALAQRKYTLRLKNTALVARQRGVDGVPTFFLGLFPLVGAHSEEVMRQVLKRASKGLGLSTLNLK